MKRLFSILILTFIIISIMFLSTACDKQSSSKFHAVPNYEVKIFMDPKIVLDSNYNLKNNIKDTFNISNSDIKMSVNYLDSKNLDLKKAGWLVRFRKKENEPNFELTYKKQYPIINGDIDKALDIAMLDGFDINENSYKAQVDWNYEKQTLSFSNVKEINMANSNDIDLPLNNDCKTISVNKIPGKLNKELSNKARYILNDAHVYGTVKEKRFIGTWDNLKLYIEICEILNSNGTEYIVETSFKTDDRNIAKLKHNELISYLNNKGWLLQLDVLKTQVILDNY